jgi:hypothetical protein
MSWGGFLVTVGFGQILYGNSRAALIQPTRPYYGFRKLTSSTFIPCNTVAWDGFGAVSCPAEILMRLYMANARTPTQTVLVQPTGPYYGAGKLANDTLIPHKTIV